MGTLLDRLRPCRSIVGVLVGVLNRRSLLGRRLARKGGPIWSEARLFPVGELRRLVREAAGGAAVRTTVRTTLWPLWPGSLPLPWGGFIALSAMRAGEDREEERP